MGQYSAPKRTGAVQSVGGLLKALPASRSVSPMFWNARQAIDRAGELSGDGWGRVGVVAHIRGQENGFLKRRRACNRPFGGFEGMGDITAGTDFSLRFATPNKPANDINHDCTEFFYLDADGNKQDADLYADMLDNPEADEFCRKQSKARCLANGMSREDADLMYGEHD